MRSFLCLTTLTCIVFAPPSYAADNGKERIQHIIVISLENHSFDNLFGQFPGAEGLSESQKTSQQTDTGGVAYKNLPPVMDTRAIPPVRDERFPIDLANKPFAIEAYAPANEKTGDLVHRFNQEQAQINDGKMDRFAAISDAGGLTMGYYDGSTLGLWKYAQEYTLADHFFHAAFGGSFLNHFWLICACTPRFENAPQDFITRQIVTDDFYAVNTVFSTQMPHPAALQDTTKLLPPQEMSTIGDRLSDKGIGWAWYAGGWNDAVAGKPDKSFQFHHQPFTYFKTYDETSEARKNHLKDEKDFLAALKNDTLPAVAFYKPLGEFNMHPGYADVRSSDEQTVAIIKVIEQSNALNSSVFIVTFDENGGYWDHVPPPKIDRFGPGVRVPTLIISPFAKKHFIDHTTYDTTSILKLIESRFDLEPLGTRDAAANNLLDTLDLH